MEYFAKTSSGQTHRLSVEKIAHLLSVGKLNEQSRLSTESGDQITVAEILRAARNTEAAVEEEIPVEPGPRKPYRPLVPRRTWTRSLFSMNGLAVWIPIFIMAALFAGLRDAKRGVTVHHGRRAGEARLLQAAASTLGTGGVVGLGVVIIPAGAGLFYLRNRQRVAQPVR